MDKKRVRIWCLSQRNDSTLMWSHYANKHNGVCLGFKIPTLYQDGERDFEACDVNYAHSINPISVFSKDNEDNHHLFYWIFTKSAVWEYEKEVRVFFNNNIGTLSNPDNELQYDFQLDPVYFQEMYFGVTTPRE